MPDVLTPFTAAVEKLSKKDATSTLIALFLVYALVAFGISASVTGSFRWFVGSTGMVSFLTGVGAFLHATLFKPDRLRAEETVRMGMLLDWIKRPDVDDEHRNSAATLLPLLSEKKSSKRTVNLPKDQRE
jgi:hypothetical protein